MGIKSSIGSTDGVVREPHAHRFKGMHPEALYTVSDIRYAMRRTAETINEIRANPDYTRLSERMVVASSEINHLKMEAHGIGASVEATIVTGKLAVVYVGYTEPVRMLTPAQQRANDTALETAFRHGDVDIASRIRETRQQGFDVEILPGGSLNKTEFRRVSSTLKGFGYDLAEARATLNNRNNLIAIGRDAQGNPAGSAVIESRDVELVNGPTIRFAELTDAFTINGGKGLYLYMSSQLVSEYSNNAGRALIYAESNMDSVPVLITARRQGRRFDGVLPMHGMIGGRMVSESVNHFTDESIQVLHNALR